MTYSDPDAEHRGILLINEAMQQEKVQTIGQIVADNYEAAKVFNAFDIDFCCGGDRTVDEATTVRGLSHQAEHPVFHYPPAHSDKDHTQP